MTIRNVPGYMLFSSGGFRDPTVAPLVQFSTMRRMSRGFYPRREFLRFLAASPLMARAWAQEALASGTLSSPKERTQRHGL